MKNLDEGRRIKNGKTSVGKEWGTVKYPSHFESVEKVEDKMSLIREEMWENVEPNVKKEMAKDQGIRVEFNISLTLKYTTE